MRDQGNISKWNDERGFGFIAPDSGGREVFVHVSALPRNVKRPRIGDSVTYDVVNDANGRPRANNVKPAGIQLSPGPAEKAFMAGTVFLSFLAAMAAYGRLPVFVLGLYVGMSVLAIGMYYIDKSAAKEGSYRISENTLHILSLLGGWPGALYAQQLLRHKSRKTSFRVVFWLTVVINLSVLVLLLSPYGSPYLAMLDQDWPLMRGITP